MISLNFGPNLGPVLVGSGSNHGSEPNIGITNELERREHFEELRKGMIKQSHTKNQSELTG